MFSLSDLSKVKSQAYQKPLRLKMIKIGETVPYSNAKGQQELWNSVVADDKCAVKAVIYGAETRANFNEGKSYLVRNYIVKREGKACTLAFNQHTRMSEAPLITVPPEVESRGETLMKVQQAPEKTVKEIKLSPKKARVTLRGRIVQVSLN